MGNFDFDSVERRRIKAGIVKVKHYSRRFCYEDLLCSVSPYIINGKEGSDLSRTSKKVIKRLLSSSEVGDGGMS